MIVRKAYEKLLDWKESANRKPLLLRGARQVGKTTIVREFAKEFDSFLELNLEREADRNLFEVDDVDRILNAAYLMKGVKPAPQSTLLFIDEIQESPKAIQMLRYFYEEKPNLHVIAAGSLLEFALRKVPSFPVGRIEYLYLHPVNFDEYLGAIGDSQAKEMLKTIPIPGYAHKTMLKLFHQYAIIGGMPEILQQYVEEPNIALLSKTYNRLWQSFKDDVEKYAQNDGAKKVIKHVMETAPYEADRIKFEGFGKSNYRSREVGEALRTLDQAKVIQLIYPTTQLKPPIVPDLRKRPRLQFLDTGMLNHILMLQGEMVLLSDMSDFHRGKMIQHLICEELISIHDDLPYKPHFWVRESKGTSSEVDIVYRYGKYVIPIEVKSGKSGRLRSLHQFVDQSDHPYAVRMYGGEFNVEEAITPGGTPYLLMNLPYYLGTQLEGYLEWFVENYRF